MDIIRTVVEDIASESDKRILAILPLTPVLDCGNGEVIEIVYAYAHNPLDYSGNERFFCTKATLHAPTGWSRTEYSTARQAVEACMYFNGFGGKTPRPINED